MRQYRRPLLVWWNLRMTSRLSVFLLVSKDPVESRRACERRQGEVQLRLDQVVKSGLL